MDGSWPAPSGPTLEQVQKTIASLEATETAATPALDTDRKRRAQEADAAPSIDSDYPAAKVLRESPAAQQPAAQPPQQAAVSAAPPPPHRQPPYNRTVKPASLEERERRRRIDQRIGAARTAILLNRFAEARAALADLAELDPALPAIREIAAELETARVRVRLKRKRLILLVGVAAAVAGAIAGTFTGRSTEARRWLSGAESVIPTEARRWLSGAESVIPTEARRWLSGADSVIPTEARRWLSGAHSVIPTSLVANAIPAFAASLPDTAPIMSAEVFKSVATVIPPATATPEDVAPPVMRPASAAVPRTTSPPTLPARVETRTPVPERFSAAVADRPAPAPRVEQPTAPPALAEQAPEAPSLVRPRVATPADAQPAFVTDDPALIRDALQRYRRAYNTLDARLAHAVYPGVDESALTRAFEALRSQSLEFEACSVDALAQSARAVCRGSARFVPRVGSREPRAEPRVWTFRLRKDDGDWTIESAWTSR